MIDKLKKFVAEMQRKESTLQKDKQATSELEEVKAEGSNEEGVCSGLQQDLRQSDQQRLLLEIMCTTLQQRLQISEEELLLQVQKNRQRRRPRGHLKNSAPCR
ncbi:hypothetical protein WMY93_013417 [Mugilogobius chulae]|uniref:Uncharacterized protein n=1 Tax=Mugilogobius chulae TaxID=88201 RepID=A0AAW0NZW0_9GOBI